MSFVESIPNERLRRSRHLKGWTQSQLAEILDTDFETVSRWERGISVPSAYFREKLCSVLDKTPAELGLIPDLTEPLTPSTSPAVFLAAAYTDAEGEFTTHLKAHLQARGITVLSSRTLRRQGVENQRKALQAAIRAAQAVLLIVSPEARSSRHIQKALQIAGIYRSYICSVWIDGEYWQECVPIDCSKLAATIDARQNNNDRVFDEIVAKLEEVRLASNEAVVSVPITNQSAEPLIEPRNPYKGLKAFHSEDRDDFFGQDTLIDELAGVLDAFLIADEKHVQSARLLAVVGPSGSGKSSIVMAGLLPRLQTGGLPGSRHWVYLDPIVPGIHPLEALTLAFAKQLPERGLTMLRDDLEDDSAYGLHLLASYLGKPSGRRVVLFIDQFEEVFTQTVSEEERQHFLDLLVTAVTEPQGPVILILTLRTDFYDRPMHYPELCKLIESNQRLVPPMDLKDLREVIGKPAKLSDVQLTFEGDLVSDLLFEVQEQVGALPLLQFTLDQLFQRRAGHQLTLQAYREIGGVKGAVAKHAEATYACLPTEDHRKLARVLFLRLIDPGATLQNTTRRRIARSELLLSNPKETVIIEEVTRAFAAARLLTTDTVGGVASVEVSHEAVIREWTRLADWLDEAREDVLRQQTISEDTTEWERSGRPPDRLYRGSQLKDAKAWARRNTPSRFEIAFLRASAARRRLSIASLVAVFLLFVSLTGTAAWLGMHQPPDPTRVTNLQDDGTGSLRWAIGNAPSGSTITFDVKLRGKIILLSSADLYINKSLHIRGPDRDNVIINSSSSDGYGLIVYPNAFVTISDLTFKNSNIYINPGGTLTLTNSTVAGNRGGGIENDGTLTLTNSTVAGNTAGNTAGGRGGGISNDGTLTLTNSTVAGNTAGGRGGGISNDVSAKTNITFGTIYGNRAQGNGGGIWNGVDNQSGQLVLRNSIVAANKAFSGSDILGSFISDGYNLIQDISGVTVDKRNSSIIDFMGLSPNVGSLQKNGGPTQTYALLSGSPAIDKIPLAFCRIDNIIMTDQRGMTRPDDDEGFCDIGAFEST